jgi:hypothetical protein
MESGEQGNIVELELINSCETVRKSVKYLSISRLCVSCSDSALIVLFADTSIQSRQHTS